LYGNLEGRVALYGKGKDVLCLAQYHEDVWYREGKAPHVYNISTSEWLASR